MSHSIGISIWAKDSPSLSLFQAPVPGAVATGGGRPKLTLHVKDDQISFFNEPIGIRGTLELSKVPTATLNFNADAPTLTVGTITAVGAGQANTASNLFDTVGAIGLFKQKVGADLQFKSLIGINGISVADSSDGNEVEIDGSSIIASAEANHKISANCLASDSVGDCVYITGDRVAGLYQVTRVDIEDAAKIPTIGIIQSKSSSTECIVHLHGVLEGVFTGMTPNKVQFIGFSGSIVESLPVANSVPGFVWIQSVGQALASDVIMVHMDPIPTKRLYKP